MPPAVQQQMPNEQRPQQSQERIDQFALVRDRLVQGASPELVAGIAMLIQQMDSQQNNTEMSLTITTAFGPFVKNATFNNGEWQGNDLTHKLTDPRGAYLYGARNAPMHQGRTLQLLPRPTD